MLTPFDFDHVTACVPIINVASHNTVNGLLENSVQDFAQAVAMTTKHAQTTFSC